MSIYKTIDPSTNAKRIFFTFKNFTSTNNDSGSGVFAIKARSGSFRNYVSSSDEITTITSGSISTNYYSLPTWNFINTRYYKYYDQVNTNIPYRSFGNTAYTHHSRSLFLSSSIINVSRELYGDRIKPGSVRLTDTSNGQTWDIRDDGDGNLYDYAHSASFAAHKSSSFSMSQGIDADGSGSVIGNVFYSDGVIVVNQKGSYKDVGFGTGYTLKHKATHPITEYEYSVVAKAGEFNHSSNISATKDRAGNVRVPATSTNDTDRSWVYRLFPPGDQPSGYGTGSFQTSYTPATLPADNITGSSWYPMVTQIGLYDINDNLIAVAKPAHPVKLSKTLSTTFVVRFDI